MSDVWKKWEGQIADDKFPLHRFLGTTDHSAVFLTQTSEPRPRKGAIKFISADSATAEAQLSLWSRAAQLSHPNLLPIYHSGRCRVADLDLLYAVMEFAEEDLSQILPQRPLAASEAREMLEPLLNALIYLHSQGLAHTHIKPSNILATADQLKLSCDTAFPIGESRKPSRDLDPYDAPELATAPLAASADVWSLGVTLVEALTQRAPIAPAGSQADPSIPETFPQPFLEIARHSVLRDAAARWTTSQIAGSLKPVAAAAAAGRSISPSAVSPLAVPLSPVSAIPAAKLLAPRTQPPRQQISAQPKQTFVLPNYVVPLFAAFFITLAIFALPKILSHRPNSSSSTTSAASQPASELPKPVAQPPRADSPKPSKPAAQSSPKSAAVKPPADQPLQPQAAATPAPAALRTDTFPSPNAPAPSKSSPARGEVLDQVLPAVSDKARATIHGTVRVGVRVHVDPSGNVAAAELDGPGPSKYFAELALQAARRWEFTSPEVNGRSVASEWLIRFHFSPSGTKAIPTQTAP
jgi:TonB family protein